MQRNTGSVLVLCLVIALMAAYLLVGKDRDGMAMGESGALERIEIDYEHEGWGKIVERYVIRRDGSDFILVSDYVCEQAGDRRIRRTRTPLSRASVGRFLDVMDAPVRSREQGLHELARTMQGWESLSIDGNEHVQASGMDSADVDALLGHVDAYYDRLPWTDDYPQIFVRVISKQTEMVVWSQAQAMLMLPWTGDGLPIWDARLPGMLASWLPSDSSARARLSGQALYTHMFLGHSPTSLASCQL